MTIEQLVSARLRSKRLSLGWSLDELASRTNISASTISRIETGKRTISLDLLVPLCEALQTDMNALLDTSDAEDDVVIRPVATPYHQGGTIWPLTRNRDAAGIVAVKMRLEPGDVDDTDDGGVHPGHDWFFVLSGVIKLTLGSREILVHEGEAAEFSTMTPHRFRAHGGPAELVSIFDRDGQRAHIHGQPDAY